MFKLILVFYIFSDPAPYVYRDIAGNARHGVAMHSVVAGEYVTLKECESAAGSMTTRRNQGPYVDWVCVASGRSR
jgi:hypothetical protein